MASDRAIPFLQRVKRQLADRPGSYDQFLNVLVDYQHQTIDIHEMTQRVETLFHGHPNLLDFFRLYLDCSQSSSQVDQQRRELYRGLFLQGAIMYGKIVHPQLRGQPHIFREYADLLRAFQREAIDLRGLVLRVTQLFRGYPELIVGFNTMLPPGIRISVDIQQRARY